MGARPAAMTKMAPQRIHTLRVRGGNKKYRALRLDQGNFSWPSEAISRKTRIIDVVKKTPIRKKRKFELARPAAMTKMAPQRIHTLRVRGGNKKYRALRLDQGNFSWPSETISRKTRIIDVVYNACNNELVRTKT